MLISTDALNHSSTNFYDANTGNLLGTLDALGGAITNFYDGKGLLVGSRDAVGTLTTNYFDASGNLTGTATLSPSGMILSTNSYAYDANDNWTNSVVWRRVSGVWIGATNTYVFDGQNRVIQTVAPDGGTNVAVFDATGRQVATIGALSRATTNAYDFQGRLIQTLYPDSSSVTNGYDRNGNRTASADQLRRVTTYVYDALNRLTQTIFADNTTNTTVYDDLGRVEFSIDARGVANAFGYDPAGRRIGVTNAWGTPVAMTNLYGFDANNNQICFTNSLMVITTNVFDALNRQVQVLYPDGTKISAGYDAGSRRVAQTNQDNVVTRFGYDGAGRLIAVTNAWSTPQQVVTQYQYDEAGNETAQIDALNRITSFAYDSMGRRIKRTLPGLQFETFGFDVVGNLIRNTNFNGVVVTNQFDLMNRLTNRASVNAYRASFAYSLTGQRTNMNDVSGNTGYAYDSRERLQSKTVAWSNGPTLLLNYGYDANGNLTNLWSSTSGGVTNFFQFDALNRLTNLIASGAAAASYGFDLSGNLQSLNYGNGVTNLLQYDSLNRLTNLVWKLNGSSLASFSYHLGRAGNRTNLNETLNGTGRTYAWAYDPLYRLTNETFTGGTSGSLTYGLDLAGNRTNRTSTLGGLTNQTFVFNPNDWQTNTDSYDSNGNTLNSFGNSCQYDPLNHLTNFNSGAVLLGYDGDGNRVRRTYDGTNTFFLLDDRNPTGYAQALEEWVVGGGATNLSRVYNYGLQPVSQKQGNTTYYFVQDGHGSTRLLLDSSGAVSQWYVFEAYGGLITSNASPATPLLYCGEYRDPNTGLDYHRARHLNYVIARFLTMDTYKGDNASPLSLHKYLYCRGNPVNLTDPTGLDGDLNESLWINFNSGFGDYTFISGLWAHGDYTVNLSEGDDMYQAVTLALSDFRVGRNELRRISISGHGSPGDLGFEKENTPGNLTSKTLDDPNSPQSRTLAFLKPRCASDCIVYLKACEQAKRPEGRKFMQQIANLVGVEVVGYDDYYALWGRGNQYTAYPGKKSDGSQVELTREGAPYEGSYTQSTQKTLQDLFGNRGKRASKVGFSNSMEIMYTW